MRCLASCTMVLPWQACIIGLIGGVIPVFGVRLISRIRVDDPIGASSVHLMCGFWVSVLVLLKIHSV